ncbi:hypothetical protein ES705_17571 [subsurface metagenome]
MRKTVVFLLLLIAVSVAIAHADPTESHLVGTWTVIKSFLIVERWAALRTVTVWAPPPVPITFDRGGRGNLDGTVFVWHLERDWLKIGFSDSTRSYLLHIIDADTISFFQTSSADKDIDCVGLFRRRP